MIFATVGTQLPFDRLVSTLDQWASRNPDEEGFVQLGQGNYRPANLEWARTVPVELFRSKLKHCDLVLAHAGMGTIISAIEMGKPVIVMPRRAELGEHRNDHQLATAERLRHLGGLEIASDREELIRLLDEFHAATRMPDLASPANLDVSKELIHTVRSFAGLEAA